MTTRGAQKNVSQPPVAGQSAAAVAQRLQVLRRLYVPESDTDARARLKRERPPGNVPFEVAAAARLRELRALCELANYLHLARRSSPDAGERLDSTKR